MASQAGRCPLTRPRKRTKTRYQELLEWLPTTECVECGEAITGGVVDVLEVYAETRSPRLHAALADALGEPLDDPGTATAIVAEQICEQCAMKAIHDLFTDTDECWERCSDRVDSLLDYS